MKIVDLDELEKTVKGDGVRVVLAEAYFDLSAGTDDELRSLRKQMIMQHMKVMKKFVDLGDKRYSSPEGNEYLRDCNYYNELVRRIENEMSYRFLVL